MQKLIFFVNKNKVTLKSAKSKQSGQAIIISVIGLVAMGIAIISGFVSPTVSEWKISNNGVLSKQSLYLSESGIEDVYYRIKKKMSLNYSSEVLSIDNGTTTTTVLDVGNQKTISSSGNTNSRVRTTKLVLQTGTGVSFNYGLQSGVGGITLGHGSFVQGSVYSNGDITGSGTITGTALSANSPALNIDQINDTGTPSSNVIFGDTNNTQDFAQSFQVSATDVVSKIDLYLKKVGLPSNLTVRIVTNNNGVPGTTELTSGALSSSLISTNYGWVSVPFSSNPELIAGTTYWIVIDSSTGSSTKYFVTGANDNDYFTGSSKIGKYSSGPWGDNDPTTLDSFFKLYLGGDTGLIDGVTVGTGSGGDAYAHTINNSTVHGTKYCQSTNKSPACNTSLADPTQVAMPVSEQNISDWKDEALSGGIYSGNYTAGGSSILGPKKITGNLSVNNNAKLTMTGTIWVVGNVDISNDATVKLDSSFGAAGGVIIVDGTVDIGNNATFTGSGSQGSYVMVLSTSTATNAITLSNNGGAVILYAANGTVNLSNNATAKSLNGKYINLNNNVTVLYDSGLVNSSFASGPKGGWNPTTWKEVE